VFVFVSMSVSSHMCMSVCACECVCVREIARVCSQKCKAKTAALWYNTTATTVRSNSLPLERQEFLQGLCGARDCQYDTGESTQ
jgi:hypothetical protein